MTKGLVRISFPGRKSEPKPLYVTQAECLALYVANRIGHAREHGFFTVTKSRADIAAFLRDFRGGR